MDIQFTLEGIHLKLYERLLKICYRHDRHTLAKSLIEFMLEEDSKNNQDALLRH